MKGPPTYFWGKLQSEEGYVVAWHPLVDHCADVAACAEALLTSTLLRRRLARLGGRDDLTGGQVARLCVLAALHDLGKFNIGFQNKSLDSPDFTCGHLGEVLGLIASKGPPDLQRRLWDVLPAEELNRWGDDIAGLLYATISHHGRPVAPEPNIQSRWWEPTENLDPFAGIGQLIARTGDWFPGAWDTTTDPLPTTPSFQHGWSGLVMLADWLGSDSIRFFPFSEDSEAGRMPFARAQAQEAMRLLGLAAGPLRMELGERPPGYERIPAVRKPRPTQAKMLDLPHRQVEEGSVVMIEAATGSGKTEAALVHFLRLYQAGAVDGMYFALPTRTAARQIYRRVCEATEKAFPDPRRRPPVVQAVPGYIKVDAIEGVPLARFDVHWPGDEDDWLRYRGWAAEHPKRYLAGAIVVGTIDQVLLSALAVPHAHLRATALLRQLVVVDEVHASDTYMTQLLESVLDQHLDSGGHALLLSATLGSSAAARLLATPTGRDRAEPPEPSEAVRAGYPRISFRHGDEIGHLDVDAPMSEKRVRFDLVSAIDEFEAVARRAIDAAANGARVLVIRNTVADCRATLQAVEEVAAAQSVSELLFRCEECIAPHHSRFARPDRELLDAAIEVAFGRERKAQSGGLVAVATQTVEQSLDLDADFMITDLCPIDVLLQRIGRLHRHDRLRPAGYESARVTVLCPVTDTFEEMIGEDGTPWGRHGFNQFVYDDFRVLQATWELLAETPEASIPQDNRRLVESATHPRILGDLVTKRGGLWETHQRCLFGTTHAERRLAHLNLLRRDTSFADTNSVLFPREGRRPTRLGEEDRLARFDPPVTGPFGEEIDELHIAHHLVQYEHVPADLDTATRVDELPGGFEFSYGPVRFLYDRLGLRSPPEDETGS